MTVNEMFKELKYAIEKNIRNTDNTIPYMSGTNRKKEMLKSQIEKYILNSKIDYELGVINEVIYNYEIKIANKMLESLDFFEIY